MPDQNLIDPHALSRTKAHNRSVQLSTEDITSELVRVLGRQLLAFIVGKDPKSLSRWAAGTHSPKDREEKILRNAYQVFALLDPVESDHTIRAWFMGMNPQLDDESPAEALSEERFRDVATAARSFVNGG
ncbi:hypothetical protein [Nesterenkonia flava]|uniref:XRE family transcriptional regulator n=1 Tax=Nesterenkonia flava TaxID=469799 RepID=A0ABU1FTG6_9MICC|nr:hypothetical protein [Nesterenkonia flava]MDR5711954.1 hypothetical protein [Nesterenkonia flava]